MAGSTEHATVAKLWLKFMVIISGATSMVKMTNLQFYDIVTLS